MKRTLVMLIVVMTMSSLAASAGSISGKVSGVTGESVVYVEAVGEKTFPAPTDQPVMDQKGLMFTPHIVAVQQGTTVRVPQQRQGGSQRLLDFRGRQQEARAQSRHLAQGREAPFQIRQSRGDSFALQRSPRNVGIHRGLADSLFRRDRQVRKLQDRQRSRWQLQRHGLARRREELVQARDCGGRGQSGFHPE